jgi:hypothetical protein
LCSGSESLLSDSDDEEESDESDESETKYFQSTFARKINFYQHIPSVLALLFLTLLGLLAFDCLFIAGILLFLWLSSKNCSSKKNGKACQEEIVSASREARVILDTALLFASKVVSFLGAFEDHVLCCRGRVV